jgi:hypothetical protein
MIDNKPIDYWTDAGKPRNLAMLTPQERLELLETLKTMEAKEWITRYKRKFQETGTQEVSTWWWKTLQDIAKKRGIPATNDLRARMNNIKRNQ